MKKLLASATFVAMVAAAGSAYAEADAGAGFVLGGSVDNTCKIGAISSTASSHASLLGTNITFAGFVDSDSMVVDSSINLSLGTAWCNYGTAKLSLKSTKGTFEGDATVPAGAPFTKYIAYNATANWGAGPGLKTISLTANTPGAEVKPTAVAAGYHSGALTLDIAMNAADNIVKIAGGSYSDTLTIQIGAAI